MNCPECGMKVVGSETFCRVCGAALNPAPTAFPADAAGLRFGPSARGSAAPEREAPDPGLRITKRSSAAPEPGLRISKRAASAPEPEIRVSRHSAPPPEDDERTVSARGPVICSSPVRPSAPAESAAPAANVPAAAVPAPARENKRTAKAAAPRRVKKQSPLGTAVVVVLALIVLAAAVYLPYRFLYLPFVQNRPLTRTAVLEKYLQAVMEHDPKTAFALTPYAGDKELYIAFQQNVVSEDDGEAKQELLDTYGKYTVKVQIDETHEYAKEVLDSALTAMSMNYEFAGYKFSDVIDTGAVAEIVQVTGTCTIKGKKGSDTTPFTATMMKYKDEWRVLDSSLTKQQPKIDLSQLIG